MYSKFSNQLHTNRPSNLRRWTSSTVHGLSSLKTFPYTPQLLFNSFEWDNDPTLEAIDLSVARLSNSTPWGEVGCEDVLPNKSSIIDGFTQPLYFFSAWRATARRFTGRSDLIILSKKMAGKLNLGITFTSYDKTVPIDLEKDKNKFLKHNSSKILRG